MKPSSTGEAPSKVPKNGAFASISKTEAAQMETQQTKVSIKSSPNSSSIAEANHVLFGRGKRFTYHPGNQRMRRILDKYRSQYFGASCAEKRKLIKKAYEEIVEGGVKFLKPAGREDEWVEVDVELAIQKVGHSLRCRRSCKGNIQASLTTRKAPTTILQNGMTTQTTSEFVGESVVGSPMFQQSQMQQQQQQQQIQSESITHPLGDELLRRAIAQRRALDLGLSLLPHPMASSLLPNPITSLLVQQLQLERLGLLPLYTARTATMQPGAMSQGALRVIEREEELLRIMSSRGNKFPGL
ncbi:unnamed protein product [Cylindrotheca closterium]|uniref:DUF6824 domain-containing protein n=1 Tax=Cylindrotheca closterium TaxID=2856 RepID=A0AAD2GC73_9STRA|nr:unnamed protein product [Cylindrotheca closterium]